MKQDAAETIALRALAWILGQDDILPLFLGSTGAGADDLRERAQDPVFLGSILDFILMDDAWIMAFCEAESLPYTAPRSARQALPGGDGPHWT